MGVLPERATMSDPKQALQKLISDIEAGKIAPNELWNYIQKSKEEYVSRFGQQSWNNRIGNGFQKVIHAILKGYIRRLKDKNPEVDGLDVLTTSQVKRNEVIMRKLAIRYGDFLLLPDVDSVLVWHDFAQPWESEILAIVSCKTSLRERIAQSCYWKLKLLSSDITKGIRVFLATTDNDKNFQLKKGRGRYDGKHRNRVISEHELDGIYILREDFLTDWESAKVKRFERIFDDITRILKNTVDI
jgi:type II restriction enzyme